MNYLILSKINSLVTRMLVYLSGDNSYIYIEQLSFFENTMHWKEERISDLHSNSDYKELFPLDSLFPAFK